MLSDAVEDGGQAKAPAATSHYTLLVLVTRKGLGAPFSPELGSGTDFASQFSVIWVTKGKESLP